MNQNSLKIKGVLLVLVSAISWGFSGACGQFLSQNNAIDPAFISFFRITVGGIILLAIEIVFRRKHLLSFLKDKTVYKGLCAYAVFGIFLCQLTYVEGIAHTNASTGTMMEQFMLIIVLAVTCKREKRFPRISEVIALIFALVAAILITTHLDFSTLQISHLGLLWGIASAFACAAYILLPVNLLKRYAAMEVTTVAMVFAGVFSVVAIQPWNFSITFTSDVIFGLSGMTLVGTVLAYIAFMSGIKNAGPVAAGLINSSELLWVTLISALWLATPISIYELIALICIIVMSLLITFTNNKK